MAHQWNTPTTASVKMPVPVTEGGYIAGEEDTAAGQKPYTIAGIKTAATLDESARVFDAFVTNIAGGSYDSVKATKTVVYSAVEVTEP